MKLSPSACFVETGAPGTQVLYSPDCTRQTTRTIGTTIGFRQT
jgi:hypothetical protein